MVSTFDEACFIFRKVNVVDEGWIPRNPPLRDEEGARSSIAGTRRVPRGDK